MVSVAPTTVRPSILSRQLVGVVLCVALIAATAWAVLAGGWVTGGGGAVVVAVTAVLEAALLATAAVPRLVAALVVPLLGLAAIVPTTLAAMPYDGDPSLGHTAFRYLTALFGGLATSTDWTFTVGLCTVLWACGYWCGWVALREHRGVLAVLPIYAVLATNVLNARTGDVIALPETIAVCLSLLVIAQMHLDSLQATWRIRRVSPLSGTRSRFAASVTFTAIALTVLALIIPPVSNADISGFFFPGGGGHGGSSTQVSPQNGPGTIQFSPAVTPGGKLVNAPQQVLTYTTDAQVPTYLRVINATFFEAGNWLPRSLANRPTGSSVVLDSRSFPAGPLPRNRSPSAGAVSSSAVVINDTVTMDPAATGKSGLIVYPGEPDALDQGGSVTGTVTNDSNTLLTVDAVQIPAATSNTVSYTSTGLVSTATADQLRHAGTKYPEFVTPDTDVRDDLTRGAETIASLAQQWTAGTTDPYDAATAIEAHLRDPKFFTYTLNPPQAPAGEWPIVYFLVTSHRGYCQYFASAMGAMLRSLGIPTRLVVGYGPGTSLNEASRFGIGRIAVSTSDSHVWVESYFPGFGWIPFEPTPPSSEGNYQPIPRGGAAAAPPTSTPSPAANSAPPLNSTNSNGSNGSGFHLPMAVTGLLSAVGVLLLITMLALYWLLAPRSLGGAWRRIEALGRWIGVRRKPSETYREYADRLATSRPQVADSLSSVAAAMGRAAYSRHGADGDRAGVLSRWRRLAISLVRSRRASTRRGKRALSSV